MYRTILVPLDGSPFAEQALPTAVHLAAGAKAPLLLARVHQPPSRLGSTWDDFFRNEAKAYLERIAARATHAQPIDVEIAVLDGDVVEALCEHAERRAECLTVMSTNGRTGLSRAWLGSVADGVLRHSTRPVLALRPSGPEHVPLASTGNVLVALDGSSFADESAMHASMFQRARWSSQSPARAARGPSWMHATHNAISRNKSPLGTKDIVWSSSSTCLKSFNNSGSRVVAAINCSRRRAFGSIVMIASASMPPTRDTDLFARCYSTMTSPSEC